MLDSKVLAVFRVAGHFARAAAALLVVGLSASCGDIRGQFLAGRVLEKCDTEWPVCDRIAGCLVGDRSYLEGKFPGTGRVAVQIAEPSTVTISFFLESVSAAGNETAISFFEDRCRARIREAITGRTFIGENDKVGYVSRKADLSGTGDHLIEWESDATARYLVKLSIEPKRLQTEQ